MTQLKLWFHFYPSTCTWWCPKKSGICWWFVIFLQVRSRENSSLPPCEPNWVHFSYFGNIYWQLFQNGHKRREIRCVRTDSTTRILLRVPNLCEKWKMECNKAKKVSQLHSCQMVIYGVFFGTLLGTFFCCLAYLPGGR